MEESVHMSLSVNDWMEFSRGGYHIYGHIHNKTQLNGYLIFRLRIF